MNVNRLIAFFRALIVSSAVSNFPMLEDQPSERARTNQPTRQRRQLTTPVNPNRRLTRGLCVLLILTLLANSTPAAPRIISEQVCEIAKNSHLAFFSNKLAGDGTNALIALRSLWQTDANTRHARQKTQDIARIEIYPGSVTVNQGEKIFFAATGFDSEEKKLSGLPPFEWRMRKTGERISKLPVYGEAERILVNETFEARAPGTFEVTATAINGVSGRVTITVIDPSDNTSAKSPTADRTPPNEVRSAEPPINQLSPPGGTWDDGDIGTSSNPTTQVGNAPGGPSDGGAHSGNFQIDAPLVSLPGRGLDVNLNLKYNARLWHKAGNTVTYDIDKGNPSPGWTFGYGKLVHTGSIYGRCLLIDGEGTRHRFDGTPSGFNTPSRNMWTSNYTGHTTDGTFIDYRCQVEHFNGNNTSYSRGTAKLPNGTTITYGASTQGAGVGFESYPTRIEDAQGNFITITYRNGQGPQIQVITDTLNRQIHFHYDAAGQLSHITAPQLGTGSERTVVRFHYRQITLAPGFGSGITVETGDVTRSVLDAIYYPGTNTGYWFHDAYSAYGMITKVQKRREMSIDANGTVNPGQLTFEAAYNYPLTADNTLTDAPMYTTRTDTWAGMTSAAPVTTYSRDNTANPRTSTVIRPDGVKTIQSAPGAGQATEGWVNKTEVFAAGSPTASSTTVTTYDGSAAVAYKSPRVTKIETTDERNQTLKTDFLYASGLFNQVTTACQYGYAGEKLRCVQTQYENSANYIGQNAGSNHTGNHIFNLVKVSDVVEANGTRVSRTVFDYDGQPLAETPNAFAHNARFNPFALDDCGYEPNYGDPDYGQPYCTIPEHHSYNPQCDGVVSDIWVCTNPFDPITNYRGNVTQIKTYTNAASLTGLISRAKRYDVTGNVVMQNTDCCAQMNFTYDPAYNYAYPTRQTRGPAVAIPDPNASNTAATYVLYDYYTGLATYSKDANGLESTVQYNAANLRVEQANSPTGAYLKYFYNDVDMLVITHTRESNNALAAQSVQYLNGLGQVKLSLAGGADANWENGIAAEYDKMGRVLKQSRPYNINNGEQPQWTTNSYDTLGRAYQTTAPDGSISRLFFNEATRPGLASALPGQTVKSRDAWGRERWARSDALGRLVEVVEPNPNGDGSVSAAGLVTNYVYNTQDNLVETIQGAQHRYFHYDSLGRLTRQKLAEQAPTLNDNGEYVGVGGVNARWSEAFSYDDRSNLIGRVDARGVKIDYLYSDDPLNRLQWIGYDRVGPRDTSRPIHWSPQVSFQYMTTGDKERVKKVTAHGLSVEDYTYDTNSRLKDHTLTIDSTRPNNPMTTSYLYDTLDRITKITYPAQYGLTGSPTSGPRREVVPTFEGNTGRLTSLSYNGGQQAGNFVYNSSEQVTSMKVGAGANQITETADFDAQTGLLTNQKVKKANGDRLLDLSYDYNRGNSIGTLNGKTGAVTGIINNLDRNKDRAYEYDALGRLTKAVGGANQTWTQAYAYDRFGNRTSVTATGVEALRGQQAFHRPDALLKQQNKANSGATQNKIAGETAFQLATERSSASAMLPPSAEELVTNVNSLISGEHGTGGPSDSSNSENETATDWRAEQNPSVNAGRTAIEETAAQPVVAGTKLEKEEVTLHNPAQTNDALPSSASVTANADSEINESAPVPLAMPTPTPRTAFDFDGDLKADISIWTRSTALWTVKKSSNSTQITNTLGASGNQIAPGDYDGDGKTDYAVWNTASGVWTIRRSSNGTTYTQQWGSQGDTIVPADYDGDGKTDHAVWRSSDGNWYILRSSNGVLLTATWGSKAQGDIAAVGDYNGDGFSDFSVWRPINGVWFVFVQENGTGYTGNYQWGSGGDVPAPADYDGDRITDLAVWRPSTGVWFVSRSTGGGLLQVTLGSEAAGDILVPADYDGDGKADIAVWRPSSGVWTIRKSTTGTNETRTLGTSGDIAVPSAYIRRSSAPTNQSAAVQRDGSLANVTFDANTNRITTAGFEYDVMGNLVRALSPDGSKWYRYEYDTANRLTRIKRDDGTDLQVTGYGAGNQRLYTEDWTSGWATVYAGAVEYKTTDWNTQANGLQWTKSYVYLGGRLLSTITPASGQTEKVEYHHPNRLGTQLVTNPQDGTSYEQTALPFGNLLSTETTGTTNQPFTSYDRSTVTGLDYAQNRTYDAGAGRFTQVDPIGISAASLAAPQSLNLYAYVENDPINMVDPSGLLLAAPNTQYGGNSISSISIGTFYVTSASDPWTLTGSAAVLAAWNPTAQYDYILNGGYYDLGGVGVVNIIAEPDPILAQGGQQLQNCIRDFLRPFFSNITIGKTTYSPVDDARFVSGLPWYASGTAITLGLRDIHYNPSNLDLTGGQDKSSIGVLAEELFHATQFLDALAVQENLKPGGKNNYIEAKDIWATMYATESGVIAAKNVGKGAISAATLGTLNYPQRDTYHDNKFEKAAKAFRAKVEAAAAGLAKSPCYP